MIELLEPIALSEVPTLDPLTPIAEAVEAYLPSIDSLNTRKTYRRHILTAFHVMGCGTFAEVGGGHLIGYRKWVMGNAKVAPGTKAQQLIALRSFFGWGAMMDGHQLRMEVVKGLLKVPKATVIKPYEILNHEERSALVKVCRNHKDRAIVFTLLGAGLRIAELAGLDCCDLRDDGTNGWMLHVRQGKGNKDRFVPVLQATADALLTYIVNTGRNLKCKQPIFLATDRGAMHRLDREGSLRVTTRGLAKNIRVLCEAAGITKRISPHSFRHTYAIASYLHGKDIVKVQKLLGHAGVGTTSRYVDHVKLTELRETIPPSLFGDDELATQSAS